MKTLLLVLGLFVCRQQHQFVEAIKCYVCQSNVDPKCADPFDNLTLPITDCDAYPRADLVGLKTEFEVIEDKSFFSSAPIKPLRANMCRKIRQKVNGEWRTIRGCGYLGPPGDAPEGSPEAVSNCQIRHGTYDIFMETCACNNKDGCNGAFGITEASSTPFLIMTTLISVLVSIYISSPPKLTACD